MGLLIHPNYGKCSGFYYRRIRGRISLMSALGNKIRSGVRSTRLWAGLFVTYVFARESLSVWQHYDDTHSTLRGFVVNGSTYYVGHAVPIMQAQEEHLRLAKQAAITMYGRNPKGLDDEETLRRLFNIQTQKLITDGVARDAMVFLSQNRTQNFKPDRDIREMPLSENACNMLVEGDVTSISQINGQSVPDSKALRLILRLERNARFGDDGKFPMVVTRFEVSYLKEHTNTVAGVK